MEGTVLSHFRILSKIGEGGMGVVYKAEDEALRRIVALKVLPQAEVADPSRRQRFLREARAAAAVSHHSIAAIHEVSEAGGVDFIAMEYVEGRSLRSVLGEGPLPVGEALRIANEIALGLERAHAVGVIHRDLKPENVIVQSDGQVKILDFGLAKMVAENRDPSEAAREDGNTWSKLTGEGSLLGTPAYMSPEQARGLAVDARSDLFSLGVILYESLSGANPFRGATAMDTLGAILRDRPVPLTSVRAGIPEALDELVAKLLAKEAAERYPSANALLQDFRAAGSAPAAPRGALPSHAPGQSIAVLPFADMSPERDQDYFCEGMAEELIGSLSKIEGLHVAARTSAFQFKGQAHDVRRIGERLGVVTVLAGSVRKAGKRLRVAVELVSASDGYQIWSERYDREMEDVFAVQDEIASAIVQKLRVRLGGPVPPTALPRRVIDLEAYHLYLKGRYFVSRYDLRKALECFEQAIAKDPSHAAAHAAQAECYLRVGGPMGFLPPKVAWPKARSEAEAALVLDANLSTALVVLAVFRVFFERDATGAEEMFRRLVERDPNNGHVHLWYAQLLAHLGRRGEAIREAEVGQAMDPLSPLANGVAAVVCYWAGAFEKAIAFADSGLEIHATGALILSARGLARLALSQPDGAFEDLEVAVSAGTTLAYSQACLGWAYGSVGRCEEARAVLASLVERQQREYVPPSFLASVHAGLGEVEQALECLERASDEPGAFLPLASKAVMPFYDSLRSNPRFADLVRRMEFR